MKEQHPEWIVLAVGQPFPYKHPKVDGSLLATRTEYFFTLSFALDKIGALEKRWFETATLHLYVKEAIPFIIIKIGSVMADCTFNMHKVNPEAREAWLTNDENVIPVCLINNITNTIEGFRVLAVGDAFADRLRQALSAQLTAYNSMKEVDGRAQWIMNNVPLEYMYARRVM